MSATPAVPWPDAAGRAATWAGADPHRAGDAARAHGPLTFLLGVFTVLVFSSTWVMFITGPDGSTTVGPLVIALYVPAYFSTLALLAGGGRASLRAALASPFLWVLMAVAVASVHWSVSPELTARRTPALILTSLAGVALAARFDWPELSEVLAASFAVIVVGCFLLAVLVPTWGRMTSIFPGAWRGLWNDKNALGDHMTVGVGVLVAAAALNPARRRLWAAFALGAVAMVVLSTSKTSLVTLVLGVAVLALVAAVRRGGGAAVVATFCAVSVLALVAFGVVFERDALFKLLGKDATLTGRTRIWAGALRQIALRPLLGFGYAAVWDDPSRWGPIHWIMKDAKYRPPHAHNSWIEIRLAMGWVGLAAFAAMFAQAWGRALVALYRGGVVGRGAWLAAPFLAVWTVQSLTESIALGYNDFTWVMLVAVACALGLPSPRHGFQGGRRAGRDAAASMAAP